MNKIEPKQMIVVKKQPDNKIKFTTIDKIRNEKINYLYDPVYDTFEKSERSITLRPENTAGVVRSYIENGMSRLSAPVKIWYKGPMFRYERPQAGRQRQFNQIGVEMFGTKNSTHYI